MVIKTDFGFKVSSKNGSTYFISKLDAYEIMRALEHDYHREDVLTCLESSGISATEEQIDEILDRYEDGLSNNGSWRDILSLVIDSYFYYNEEHEEDEDG